MSYDIYTSLYLSGFKRCFHFKIVAVKILRMISCDGEGIYGYYVFKSKDSFTYFYFIAPKPLFHNHPEFAIPALPAGRLNVYDYA